MAREDHKVEEEELAVMSVFLSREAVLAEGNGVASRCPP